MTEEKERLELEKREAEAALAEIGRTGDRLIRERDGLALDALRGDEGAVIRCDEIAAELASLEGRRTLAGVVHRRAKIHLQGLKMNADREAQLEADAKERATREEAFAVQNRMREVIEARYKAFFDRGAFSVPAGSPEMLDVANKAEQEVGRLFGEDALRFRDRQWEAGEFGVEFDYQQRKYVRVGQSLGQQTAEAIAPGIPI